MGAVMDAGERRKAQDALLRSVEGAVRQMRSDADVGNIDQLSRSADIVAEITKQKDFPSQRAQDFQRTVKFIQREAYERSVSNMLGEIIHHLHTGDEDFKNSILPKLREHVGLAGRFGADMEFKASVERHLQQIQMTTGEGIDKRAKAEAARKTELHDTVCKAPGGVEHRRAIRYIDPVLIVRINDQNYNTLNWSVRGLLLENFVEPLPLGSFVWVVLSCEGVAGGGRNKAKVVRRIPKQQEIAFEFPDISAVVLGLMHEMRLLGIRPEPG
ncbi:MAG: PilZ domain-containing protein [Rhodospirillaceae bacterium]